MPFYVYFIGIPLTQRFLIFYKNSLWFTKNDKITKVFLIQKQVPLPLPCFNFAQIAALASISKKFNIY